MKNTKKICRIFLDMDKKLEYLNRMNAIGWKIAAIPFGVFYHFVQADPGRYQTVWYMAGEQEQADVIRMANECGCELVPHANDGWRDLLYFNVDTHITGNAFITSNAERLRFRKRMARVYGILAVIQACIIARILLSVLVTIPYAVKFYRYNPALVWDVFGERVWMPLAILLLVVCIILTCRVYRKNKRMVRELKSDIKIYE